MQLYLIEPKGPTTALAFYRTVDIFTFSDQYDIDGKVLGNSARYINHSCDPNCEVEITRRSIWIVAIRDILTGEELSYNYGYGMETYGDFPCNCKAKNCVRYILAEEYWGLIKKKSQRF